MCPAARLATLVSASLLWATTAVAQGPPQCTTIKPGANWICVEGGWRPANQVQAPVSQVLQTAPDSCTNLNPYLEPDRALACVLAELASRPTPPLPVFEVGKRYRHAYPGRRMVVLSTGSSLEGVPIVTAQYIASDNPADVGQVFAFKVLEGGPWTVLP